MLTLAFYKGEGGSLMARLGDAAIRKATGGRFSHVEAIAGLAQLGREHLCHSSSLRDGGVRTKTVFLDPDRWELLTVAADERLAVNRIQSQSGLPYDWRGLLCSQFFAMGDHSKRRWFCSEIVAYALGFHQPQRISPQMLHDVLSWQVRAS